MENLEKESAGRPSGLISFDEHLSQLAKLNPSARLEVERPDGLMLHSNFAFVGGMKVLDVEGDQNWRAVSNYEGERLALFLPTAGVIEATLNGGDFVAGGNKALLVGNREVQKMIGRTDGVYAHIMVQWDMVDVLGTMRKIYGVQARQHLSLDSLFELKEDAGQLITFLARSLTAGAFPQNGSSTAAALIAETMLRMVLENSAHEVRSLCGGRAIDVGSRYIEAAVDLMREKLHEPLTLGAISEAVGVSGRSLQEGFRRHYDTTPLAYLRNLRLETARIELSRPDNQLSVAEVAEKWGFKNKGRFAVLYREAFGESPSETIRNSYRRR